MPAERHRLPLLTGHPEDPLTPERIREIRLALGLTLAEAAAQVGVQLRAWQRWEQDSASHNHRSPRGPAEKLIRNMAYQARFKGKHSKGEA